METKQMLDLITDLVPNANEIQFTIEVLEMYDVKYDIEDFKQAVKINSSSYFLEYDNYKYSIYCRDIIDIMNSIETNIKNYVELLKDISKNNKDFIEQNLNQRELTDKEKEYCKNLGYDVI